MLGTENPVAEIARLAHEAGALVLVDGAQAAPKLPLDVAELGVDFYALPGTSSTGRPGSARSGAGWSCCEAMPPFMGGGSMIRKVSKEGTTYADPPARFEAGTPAIAQAIGMASALRWLDGLGMEAVLAHERDRRLRAGAAARGPRACGSSARRAAPSGSAPSPSSWRASTPTTSPRSSTATASRSAPATTAPRC